MVSFGDLPVEIFLQVISHLRSARDLAHLSLVNRKLQRLVEKDGYRVLLQHSFPHTPVPIPVEYAGDNAQFFKDAAHSLTTLARNWDRKAIVAQQVLPFSASPSHRHGFRSRQTMGYTPVLDSREEWYGGDWRDRYQILACGGGAQLYVQITNLAKNRYPSVEGEGSPYQPKFAIYDEKGLLDGRDDISAIKLLPQRSSGKQEIVVGRCNGDLAVVTFDKKKQKFRRRATLKTGDPPVKSLDLNSSGMLAVACSDRVFELYNVNDDSQDGQPMQQTTLPRPHQLTKTHTLAWLNPSQMIVGSANTPHPIEIFDAHMQSIRQFELPNGKHKAAGAAYSLVALHGSTQSNQTSNNTFLSGGYDGRARLHDLRDPRPVVMTFEDNIDYSAVYSLVAYGQDRFVAGGAAGLLKVFDLRRDSAEPHQRFTARDAIDANHPQVCHKQTKSGWNVFLSSHRWTAESPIYALSKPSDHNPTLFAGIEGTVFQLDINAVTDKFPDPMYGEMPRTGHRGHDIRVKWGFKRRILQLSMYEHPKSTTESVKLRKQRPLGYYESAIADWDERWQ